MVTLLRIFKLLVVASFFWRKNPNIVFPPSFYALRSKSLASLYGRRKYPHLAELKMECLWNFCLVLIRRTWDCRNSESPEELGSDHLQAWSCVYLSRRQNSPPWPWLTLSGFTICSCPLGLGPALSTKTSTSPARPQWPVPAYTTVRLGTAWSRIWLHDLIA